MEHYIGYMSLSDMLSQSILECQSFTVAYDWVSELLLLTIFIYKFAMVT